MKIYDCFTFFNELDLLEIRLQELYDVVDYFVIVESDTSFRGNPKPFYLQDNWQRFNKFHDKIRYIQVTDMPHREDSRIFIHYMKYCNSRNLEPNNAWTREAYQRDCISRGLYDVTYDCWIIISDCDEIIRASSLQNLQPIYKNHRIVFNLALFYYRINYINKDSYKWPGPLAIQAHQFTSPQQERALIHKIDSPKILLEHAGWHWSYLGDDHTVKYKIKNFAHTEHDTPEMMSKINISNMVQNHANMFGSTNYCCVNITDYWPQCIVQDASNKYQDIIATDNNMLDIFDIYP